MSTTNNNEQGSVDLSGLTRHWLRLLGSDKDEYFVKLADVQALLATKAAQPAAGQVPTNQQQARFPADLLPGAQSADDLRLRAVAREGARRAQAGAVAAAIHYPDCWDTAAYPTLDSALAAVYHAFKCSECATPVAQEGEQSAPSKFGSPELQARILAHASAAPTSTDASAQAAQADVRDAVRYRWLKANIREGYELPGSFYLADEDTTNWDRTIDASISESTPADDSQPAVGGAA